MSALGRPLTSATLTLPNASRRAARARGICVIGLVAALGAGGCSTARRAADDGGADASGLADAAADGGGQPDAERVDASTAWRHTIVIDGVNDFAPGESFATTTAGYTAYLTWDAAALYLGYQGADVLGASPTTWLFAYLDVDPGAGTGAVAGEQYNTQAPSFPTGFGAEHYLRLEASASVEDLKSWNGASWAVSLGGLGAARSGDFVEVALPLSALGAVSRLGVTVFWLNEDNLNEWAYGGLYGDAFVDGYHAELAIGRYLELDRASLIAPADPANARP